MTTLKYFHYTLSIVWKYPQRNLIILTHFSIVWVTLLILNDHIYLYIRTPDHDRRDLYFWLTLNFPDSSSLTATFLSFTIAISNLTCIFCSYFLAFKCMCIWNAMSADRERSGHLVGQGSLQMPPLIPILGNHFFNFLCSKALPEPMLCIFLL